MSVARHLFSAVALVLAASAAAVAQPYAWFPTNYRSTFTTHHPSGIEIVNLATGLQQSLDVPDGVFLGEGVYDPATGRVLVITAGGTGQFQVSPPALLPQVLPWTGDSLFLSPDGRFAYVCTFPPNVRSCQLRRRSDDSLMATYGDVGSVVFAPDGGHLVRTTSLLRSFSAADPLHLVWSRTFDTPFAVSVGQSHTFVTRFPAGSSTSVLSRIDPATGFDVVSRNLDASASVKAGGGRVFQMTLGGIWPFISVRLRSFDGETLMPLVDRDPALTLTKTNVTGFDVSPDGRRVWVRLFTSGSLIGLSLFDGDTLTRAGTAHWYGDIRAGVVPPEPWCVMSVSPSALSLPVEGGVVDFTVSVTGNCGEWGVQGGGDGSYLDSAPIRHGPAVVRLFVGRNTNAFNRSAFIGLGPYSFTVTTAAETQAPEAPRIVGVRTAAVPTTITWTPSPSGPHATGFVVEGGVIGGPVLQQIDAPGNVRSIDLPPLPPGSYFAQVRSRNEVGTGAASAPVTFTISPASAPQPPAALAVEVRGTTVTLSWQAPTSGPAPAFYVIEGAVAGGGFAEVGRTTDSRTEFTVGGVPAGSFQVRVRAGNSVGLSGPTNAEPLLVSACSGPPGAPGPVRVVATGLLTTLVWDAPASGADRYVLAGEGPLSMGTGNPFSFATSSPAPSLDAPVPNGNFRVRVRGRNACGLGPASLDTIVTVPWVSPFP